MTEAHHHSAPISHSTYILHNAPISHSASISHTAVLVSHSTALIYFDNKLIGYHNQRGFSYDSCIPEIIIL